MVLFLLPSISTITSAFFLKLTTSLDDLLWLSPFLSISPSIQNKFKHSLVYFIICVVVTMVAFIFGTTVLTLINKTAGSTNGEGYWNPERFLSIFSSSVLIYIARNEYNDWKEENDKNTKKMEKKKVKSSLRTLPVGITENTPAKGVLRARSSAATRQNSSRSLVSADIEDVDSSTYNESDDDDSHNNDDDSEDEIREKIEEASKSLRQFITVCVMGTLDDMIVFSAFVASGSLSSAAEGGGGIVSKYLALFIGTTFAALLIVSISWFFSEITCFKRMVKKIPMWGLLGGFAIYILIMGMM